MNRGGFTLAEIESQPEAWHETLSQLQGEQLFERLDVADFDDVVFTGCGSTYYLAVAAATLFQDLTGVPARGLPASEVWLRAPAYFSRDRRSLLVTVSRSGNTTETVRAVAAFREKSAGTVITLSCYPDSALAHLGDHDLVMAAGQERSIAQTRAFSVLFLSAAYLAHRLAGGSPSAFDGLPAACSGLIGRYRQLAASRGKDLTTERFYVLGSGPRYGIACELSLKLKEMTLSHSEPFHFLEFRHGPQSMVTDQTLIIGLLSEEQGVAERAVLTEMGQRGARVLSLGPTSADVTFDQGVEAGLRDALYLPVIQLLAYERSLAKGLDPDRPQNLEAVVMLE